MATTRKTKAKGELVRKSARAERTAAAELAAAREAAIAGLAPPEGLPHIGDCIVELDRVAAIVELGGHELAIRRLRELARMLRELVAEKRTRAAQRVAPTPDVGAVMTAPATHRRMPRRWG